MLDGATSESTDMKRSRLRVLLAEGSAVLGMGFGIWLIHSAFQPGSNLPNFALVSLGALDILICFALLSYFLRLRLREQEPLPRRWIAGGIVLVAGFLGWLAALFLDADRLLVEEQHHREIQQQLSKLDDSVRHMGEAMAVAGVLDRNTWDVNHDQYARLHDQLQATTRSRPTWTTELTRIDEQVKLMKKAYTALPIENVMQQRVKLAGDFQLARDRAVQLTETLRDTVVQSEREVIVVRRARWHGVGAGALSGCIAILGCVMLWLVFDRELQRSWKMHSRLADAEVRFRGLIENDAEPLAVVDGAGAVVYASPAWQTAFGREPADLLGAPLMSLIHVDDRSRVLTALQNRAATSMPCRLSGDYGVWHDVEMHVRPQSSDNTIVVRIGDVREAPEFTPAPTIELHPDAELTQKLQDAQARIKELESKQSDRRDRDRAAEQELECERWLGKHRDAGSEGLLILDVHGQVLSWNPAFAQLWKLSAETMAGHTWLTIAAHMESLTKEGWSDFHAVQHTTVPTDTCWDMTLEDGKRLEVYAQVLRDHPENVVAVRFQFRDVTRSRDLEERLRHHEEQAKQAQKRIKQLDKEISERDRQRKELDADLLELQDRLHQSQRTSEDHETMRRLAADVSHDINNALAIVLGNTEVLRDALPPEHVAQKHLDDIHQSARKILEHAQRLHALPATDEETPQLKASA